jgi:peptidyl-prolyl cis-trans isomerase C
VGWVSPAQLASPIADVVGTLGKGGYNKTPIKLSNAWVIIQVEDTRSSKIPSFDASKNQLRQAIIQQYLAETIKRLRETARVVQ